MSRRIRFILQSIRDEAAAKEPKLEVLDVQRIFQNMEFCQKRIADRVPWQQKRKSSFRWNLRLVSDTAALLKMKDGPFANDTVTNPYEGMRLPVGFSKHPCGLTRLPGPSRKGEDANLKV